MCSGPSRSEVSSPAEDILPRAMGKGGKLQMEAASPRGLGLGGQGDLGREISELDGLVGSIPGHISVLVGNCPTGKSRDFHPNLQPTWNVEFWVKLGHRNPGFQRQHEVGKIFPAGEATQSQKPALCVC